MDWCKSGYESVRDHKFMCVECKGENGWVEEKKYETCKKGDD